MPTISIEQAVSEYGAMMQRIVASHEANPSAQQDLMQDVLMNLWQALPKFRGEGSIKAFVARVTQNRCLTHISQAAKQPRGTEPADAYVDRVSSVEDTITDLQAKTQLLSAVQKLPINLKQVITLYLEGFKPKEIAEICGLSENNVSVRLNRARTTLSKQIQANQP